MLEVNFSPFPDLTTERLLLVKPSHTFVEDLFELRSNKDVMKYVNRPLAKTLDDVHNLISKINEIIATNQGINWFIALKENPSRIIGNIGIWQLDRENYRGEIGYMLHQDFWQKGITNEAIAEVVKYGFAEMKLHSIEAKINPLNLASAAVLEKNGFVKEAHFKENLFWNGEFFDTIIYSLLNK